MEERKEETLDLIKSECDLLKETLVHKNNSYGNSALERPIFAPQARPWLAIFIRMSDKVKRLEYLLTHYEDSAPFNETILDTLQDLAGYAILERIAWRQSDDCQRLFKKEENDQEAEN